MMRYRVGRERQAMVTQEDAVGGVQSQCRLDPNVKPHPSAAGFLFDYLRTVTPSFSLSLGQSQPGRLCGHLRRVTRREAL